MKQGFHFTTQPIEGDPDALSSPLVIVFKKIERASPVPRLGPSAGDSPWDLWWWRRLSLSSCCDTLFSSFSTNWAKPCWFCLKLEDINTATYCMKTPWVRGHLCCVWRVSAEYPCSSRLRWFLVSWVLSLSLLSLCTWVLKASKRTAKLWNLWARWPVYTI